jgi:hypothetical protein
MNNLRMRHDAALASAFANSEAAQHIPVLLINANLHKLWFFCHGLILPRLIMCLDPLSPHGTSGALAPFPVHERIKIVE